MLKITKVTCKTCRKVREFLAVELYKAGKQIALMRHPTDKYTPEVFASKFKDFTGVEIDPDELRQALGE